MKTVTHMADVLVELADPGLLAEFRKNPIEFLKDRNLNEEEREALISGNGGLIRYYAKGITGQDFGDDPDKRHRVEANLVAIVATDVIEIVAAVGSPEATSDSIWVDKNGNYFTLESSTKKP
ncbi:MAG TPA: hypothetical protein VF622_11185 [Segetibacter sp.]|jgi:hypothetical protein